MYGATYVRVSYLGPKASGDGSAGFPEDKYLALGILEDLLQ